MKLEIRDFGNAHTQLNNMTNAISTIEDSINSYRYVLNSVTEAWESSFADSVSTKEEIENKIQQMEAIVSVASDFVEKGHELIEEALRLSEKEA